MYDLIKYSFQSNLEKKIITLQENSKVKYISIFNKRRRVRPCGAKSMEH